MEKPLVQFPRIKMIQELKKRLKNLKGEVSNLPQQLQALGADILNDYHEKLFIYYVSTEFEELDLALQKLESKEMNLAKTDEDEA